MNTTGKNVRKKLLPLFGISSRQKFIKRVHNYKPKIKIKSENRIKLKHLIRFYFEIISDKLPPQATLIVELPTQVVQEHWK